MECRIVRIEVFYACIKGSCACEKGYRIDITRGYV